MKAATVVDECVGKILDKTKQLGGAAIITADHGNFEKMCEPGGDPHTAHTIGDVPLIVFDEKNKTAEGHPGHPLYMKRDTPLVPWEAPS